VIGLVSAPHTGLDFEMLMREHQSMVFSLAYHFLHQRDTAEEVAQEVFLSLHRNLKNIQSPAHAVFWLRKVTVQRAIDEGRRRSRRPQVALEDVAEPAAQTPQQDPLLRDTLQRLIALLPEAPRAVMILRYQEDLDPAEIAEILGMPVATVKSHQQRSLALLRQKLARPSMGEL
jgi:RNA polymerase sigma-70 factor, ECF subfamily